MKCTLQQAAALGMPALSWASSLGFSEQAVLLQRTNGSPSLVLLALQMSNIQDLLANEQEWKRQHLDWVLLQACRW